VSLKDVPARVRAYLYEYWAGLIVAGLGVLGFVASFFQVGSAPQAGIDVHTDIPVFAYLAIAAWLVGIVLMWHGRRRLVAAMDARSAEKKSALFVGVPRAPEIAGDAGAAAADEASG
jgi:hypothetical protein